MESAVEVKPEVEKDCLEVYSAQVFQALARVVKEGDTDGYLSFSEIAMNLTTAKMKVCLDEL